MPTLPTFHVKSHHHYMWWVYQDHRTFISFHVSNNRKINLITQILSEHYKFCVFLTVLFPYLSLTLWKTFQRSLTIHTCPNPLSLNFLLNILLCDEFELPLKILCSLKPIQVVAHFSLFIFQLREHQVG